MKKCNDGYEWHFSGKKLVQEKCELLSQTINIKISWLCLIFVTYPVSFLELAYEKQSSLFLSDESKGFITSASSGEWCEFSTAPINLKPLEGSLS